MLKEFQYSNDRTLRELSKTVEFFVIRGILLKMSFIQPLSLVWR